MTLQPIGLNPNMIAYMPNIAGQYKIAPDSIFGLNTITIPQTYYPDPFATLYTNNITENSIAPSMYSMFYWEPAMNLSVNTYPQTDYYIPQYNLDALNYDFNMTNYMAFGDLTKKNKNKKISSQNFEKNAGSLQLSDKELDRLGFNTPELKERWKHLKPEFQRALIKLTNYAESKGIKISYGRRSTWRSNQDQVELKKERGHYAAKPGHSPHEQGIAVDITTTSVNGNKRSNRENQALLGAYWEKMGYRWGGHFQNFAKEPWHFDIKATRS